MADFPILFSGPMVVALLAGRKTMTRRLAWRGTKPTPWRGVMAGDRLWVRERLTRKQGDCLGIPQNVIQAAYAADGADVLNEHGFNLLPWWRGDGDLTPLHMPRFVSRLTLTITATKIERIQEISEADAMAEGWPRHPELSDDPEVHRDAARDWFSDLWEDLHGAESWKENPFVVVLAFTVDVVNIDTGKNAAA